ncbi:MAG: PAS domain S-box protein [Acidobacteriia bacterium]|nr:PAS domain S-box protein [Terriglobia bacterium]
MASKLFDRSLLGDDQHALEFVLGILESSTEYSVIGKDLKGNIVLWNEGAHRMYGYEPEEVVGKANSQILHTPEDIATGKPQEIMDAALHDGKWEGTIQRRRKNGEEFTARVVITPRRNANGKPIGFLLISKDISDEIRLTEELKATQFCARSLIESNIDALMTIDPLGIITDVNQQMELLTGYSRVDLINTPFKNYFTDPGRAEDGIRLVLREGKVTNYELTAQAKDKRVTAVSYNASTFKDAAGKLLGVIAAARDITEQKALNEEIQTHSARLQIKAGERLKAQEVAQTAREIWELTFDSVPDPIVVIGDDCRIVQANRAVSIVTGLEPGKIIGKHCYEVLHNMTEAREDCPHQDALRTGEPARGDIYEPWLDKYFATTAAPLKGSDGKIRGCVHVFRDITEQKKAAESLRESEVRFRQLAENIGEVFYIMGQDGKSVVYVSPAYEEVWGRTCESLRANPMSWLDAIHPSDRARVEENYIEKVHAGIPYQAEYQIIRPDKTTRWILDRGFPAKDDGGKLVRFVGIAEDITKRRNLEVQLILSQKMEAVGRLAGGVAHDFNNLLTVILGNGQIILDKVETDEAIRKPVSEILQSGERAAQLTRQLLAFSRKQVLEPRVIDLNYLVAEMDNLLRRLIGENIELVAVCEKNVGNIKADPGQIEQVIMNLAVNSRDAMPHGGRLTLETANSYVDESYVSTHMNMKPGPVVMLVVSDTGVGIPDQVKPHIFEPFFTTKEPTKGTGLGLATVYGIVKQSGGEIFVYSELGRGTTFKIYFPRVEASSHGLPSTKVLEPALGGNETILLVEDEPAVRNLTLQILHSKGYRVLEAENGEKALALAKSHKEPVDLVLTDMVMPGISGRELAERLVPLLPKAKFLYMSGYTGDAIVRQGELGVSADFIQKPFSPDSLARKVRDVLGKQKS